MPSSTLAVAGHTGAVGFSVALVLAIAGTVVRVLVARGRIAGRSPWLTSSGPVGDWVAVAVSASLSIFFLVALILTI
jgi:hypothetical protein